MVLGIGVIPLLDSPERAVAELARVIKPGGYLVMTADNRRRLDVLLDPLKSPAFSPARKLFKSVFRVSYWGWHPAPAGTIYFSVHTIFKLAEVVTPPPPGRGDAPPPRLRSSPYLFFTSPSPIV